jgi:hypothetical protein
LYGDPKTTVTGYTDDSLLQRFPNAKYFALFFPKEIDKVLARAKSKAACKQASSSGLDADAVDTDWFEQQMVRVKQGISTNLYLAIGMFLALVVSMVSVVVSKHTLRG